MATTRMQEARRIGLLICERFSQGTLDYIEEYDPDLHFDIMKERKKKGVKDK